MDQDRFQLDNTPRPAARKRHEAEPTRQTVLFAGLDCLPGQRDLFATDGHDGEETR